MNESNAGSMMELLTNTMDWAEEALALARVMGDSSSSAIMITHGAQRACNQADICCESQSVRAASGRQSWRLLYSNRWLKGEGRSCCGSLRCSNMQRQGIYLSDEETMTIYYGIRTIKVCKKETSRVKFVKSCQNKPVAGTD